MENNKQEPVEVEATKVNIIENIKELFPIAAEMFARRELISEKDAHKYVKLGNFLLAADRARKDEERHGTEMKLLNTKLLDVQIKQMQQQLKQMAEQAQHMLESGKEQPSDKEKVPVQ